MSVNVPFLPQEGITSQILSAINLANQHSADQKAAQQRDTQLQQQKDIADQENATRQQQLAQQKPLVDAQTAEAQSLAATHTHELAMQQHISDLLSGDAPHSEDHVAAVVGPHADPTVDVSNPMGQQLATPPAPEGSTQAGSTPVAPAAPAQGGIAGMTAEVARRIGGFTPSEQNDADLARETLNLNPTVAGVMKYQQDLHGIVAKRGDPLYAAQVSFEKKGMSEQDAKMAAVRNQATDAALTKLETDPAEMTGDKGPSAQALLKTLGNNPNLTPVNKERVQRLQGQADLAVRNSLAFDSAKKKAEQAAKDGDPDAAAKLLVNHDVAPSEITTGRNSEFGIKAFAAAKKLDPTFSPQKAQADFDAAKSQANLGFFGPAASMIVKGGTLDQLNDIAKKIPNGKIPVLNTLQDWRKVAMGDGPLAEYAAKALGLADDYSKITGGGGSDSSREAALHLIPPNASPEARAGATRGIRGTVGSQIQERIGTNEVLKQQYGYSIGLGNSSRAKDNAPEAKDPLSIF